MRQSWEPFHVYHVDHIVATGQTFCHRSPRKNVSRLSQPDSIPAETAGTHSMAVPPGNRLEALKGNRKGQHSIRINDQWRICFCWREDGPHQVEIVDYH